MKGEILILILIAITVLFAALPASVLAFGGAGAGSGNYWLCSEQTSAFAGYFHNEPPGPGTFNVDDVFCSISTEFNGSTKFFEFATNFTRDQLEIADEFCRSFVSGLQPPDGGCPNVVPACNLEASCSPHDPCYDYWRCRRAGGVSLPPCPPGSSLVAVDSRSQVGEALNSLLRIVEDQHWSDESKVITTAYLEMLAETPSAGPWIVMAAEAARDDDSTDYVRFLQIWASAEMSPIR